MKVKEKITKISFSNTQKTEINEGSNLKDKILTQILDTDIAVLKLKICIANLETTIEELEQKINKKRIEIKMAIKDSSRSKAKIILKQMKHLGGFELEFVSISRVINHMTCYNSSALIGGKYIFITKKSCTRFALQSECCNFNQ